MMKVRTPLENMEATIISSAMTERGIIAQANKAHPSLPINSQFEGWAR
ncbi:MAG: hypothetical protein U9Q82_09765 [Chloroflexota bacterium]|nr:hypothetical protein [Chloroflexota bacterium]